VAQRAEPWFAGFDVEDEWEPMDEVSGY